MDTLTPHLSVHAEAFLLWPEKLALEACLHMRNIIPYGQSSPKLSVILIIPVIHLSGHSVIGHQSSNHPVILTIIFQHMLLTDRQTALLTDILHHDCVTSGQYVLFQHTIIVSLDYDGPI